MTKDRDFKKLVRTRMAHTGESYAAARAQLATHAAAGVHPETCALVRLLVAAGITGPDGVAPTEPLALGLGGGIGAAAFTFAYKGHPPSHYVATRCQPQLAYDAAFVHTAAARFGASCAVTESTSPAVAARKLAEHVARGPVMAWVDLGSLPWSRKLGGAAELGAMPHVIVVDSVEDGTAIVHDTPARPFAIATAELGVARKRLRVGKHRLLAVAKAKAPDPRVAIREAIVACAGELAGRTKVKGPMAKNFGVAGLARWAKALREPKDPKAWTRVFPPAHAASALAWVRHWIEHAGTGGGAFRPMYATFLETAAAIVKRPALRELARDYRVLGTAWSAFATAALPERARRAQDARHSGFIAGDLEAMVVAEARLTAALAELAYEPGALAAHYADLGTRLAEIVATEEACAARLASVFDRA